MKVQHGSARGQRKELCSHQKRSTQRDSVRTDAISYKPLRDVQVVQVQSVTTCQVASGLSCQLPDAGLLLLFGLGQAEECCFQVLPAALLWPQCQEEQHLELHQHSDMTPRPRGVLLPVAVTHHLSHEKQR